MRSDVVRLAGLLSGSALALVCGPAWAQTAASAPAEAAVTPARAQAAQAHPDDEYEVEELVVAGGRVKLPGSVVGDAVPEITLDQREIRALGVSSVTELLAALEPQLASGRGSGGRPIILVNGMRISSFAEIRDLPPEAIVRMEILPEEVSLRYGYRADQRVVNMVLRRRFQALTTEGGVTVPKDGDRTTWDADANVLRLQGDTRVQLDVKGSYSDKLLESDRNIVRTDGQNGALRTLLSESQSLVVNGVYARPFGEGMSGSLNGAFEINSGEGRLGASGDPNLPAGTLDPLRRLTDTTSAHLGGAVNGAISGWRWNVTANLDRDKLRTITETGYDSVLRQFLPATVARSTSLSADVEAVVNGTLLDLPAGGVNVSVTAGLDTLDLSSEAFRRNVTTDTDLDRQSGTLRFNADVPLLSSTRGEMRGLGSLSVNFNAEVNELSDFGTLTVLGGGVTYQPIDQIRLIASFTDEDGAPTVQQLGNPQILTPAVRVFDFTRGETVEVNQLSGGNPNLDASNRQVAKLGLTLKPFKETDFVLRADYTRTRIEDELASFPAATPEIEAAFPDRFTRDASGRLTQVDIRPINFAKHDRDELRWGFNFSKPIRNTRPPPWVTQRPAMPGAQAGQGAQGGPAGQGGQPAQAGQGGPPPGDGPPPEAPRQQSAAGGGAGGGFGGPGGPGGGGFGPGGGRGFGGPGGGGGGNLQFAVFHTWRMKDEVQIRPGVPTLDLLNGDTLGGSSVEPKHQIEAQAGVSRNGLGARLVARWQQGGDVESAANGGLDFSDLTTVNLRLFADLGMQEIARNNTWLRGARVSFSVDNIFNEKVDVRDATGAIPINYQPDLIDPQGRIMRLSFRKIFVPPRAVPPPGQQRQQGGQPGSGQQGVRQPG